MSELDTAYDVISDATRRAIAAGRRVGDHDPMKVVDYVIGCMLSRVDAKVAARNGAAQCTVTLTAEQWKIAASMRADGAYWHEIATALGFVKDREYSSLRKQFVDRLGPDRGGRWWADEDVMRRRGESFDDYRKRVAERGA